MKASNKSCSVNSAISPPPRIKGGVCVRRGRSVHGAAGARRRENGFLPRCVQRKTLRVSEEEITDPDTGGVSFG